MIARPAPSPADPARLRFRLIADGPILRISADRYFVAEIARGMNDREAIAAALAGLWNAEQDRNKAARIAAGTPQKREGSV